MKKSQISHTPIDYTMVSHKKLKNQFNTISFRFFSDNDSSVAQLWCKDVSINNFSKRLWIEVSQNHKFFIFKKLITVRFNIN